MLQHQDALKTTDFDSIRLRLASPEKIREWSHGQIQKPETINYRTQKPEKTGLFAEEIFGPSKDWECYCGKYKKIRYKGIICDKCGVEVTRAIVRRERMGHIELAAPVTHIWFLRGVPSKIGTILDMSVMSLEKVIYFANFIITDVDYEAKEQAKEQLKAEYKSKKKMIEGEFKRDVKRAGEKHKEDEKKLKEELAHFESVKEKKLEELEEDFVNVDKELKELEEMQLISEAVYRDWSLKYGHIFDAAIGAEAIQRLLKRIDIEETSKMIEQAMTETRSVAKQNKMLRRLKLLRSLQNNDIKPEWMVLEAVPVIPPDLRPMVALDGGRFATSDLNDLYRRVINRNNRLRRLFDLGAPEVIARNEKRMLQEAVDALFDNSARRSKTVIAATGKKRQLKSLADNLKGKQGRFRQNLLGKRIDYSGRSVIVVGPHLKIHECGIPKRMALELFKPFVISKLIEREYVHNIRSANRFIESDHAEVWDILEEVVADAYVLLNRAPTLHRLGIQAFRPKLIEGKALQIHPLVCDAYNADFDGDQMAVHVPLTQEAKREAEEIMLASKNLLKPAHGHPVAKPGKDIVWAMFYLTMVQDEADEEKVKSFPSEQHAQYAFDSNAIGMHEWIRVRLKTNETIITTIGRIIVNQHFPEKIGFINETMGKKIAGSVVRQTIELYDQERAAVLLDDLKDLGFSTITKSGFSYGIAILPDVEGKTELIKEGEERIREVEDYYSQGLLTQNELHSSIVKIWTEVKDRVSELVKTSVPNEGPAYTMIESGARGQWGQMTQTIGMIGLKSNPSGEIIELPVKSSFKDGVNVLEYFISSHGVRKGLTDTALRTANAGYLTRRLVDVAQDIVIREVDCGDKDGVLLTKEESDEIGEPLLVRILGRRTLSPIVSPDTGDVIVKKGALITQEDIRTLEACENDLHEAHVRSVLTCKTALGVCQKCYGYDLAYNKEVRIGTAVGIMAAQSIGEPGTQLTMRTFHTGGVAGKDITQGLPRVEELFEARNPKQKAVMTEVSGTVEIEKVARETIQAGTGKKIVDTRPGQNIVRIKYTGIDELEYKVGRGADVKVKDGGTIKVGDVLAVRKDGEKVISDVAGTAKIERATRVHVIYESEKVREYVIPAGYSVFVKDGDEVEAGDQLSEGHLDLKLLFKHKGREAVQKYLSKEIQYIYTSQGQKVNNKHIELIIRQMFSRVQVIDPGDTDLLPGEIAQYSTFVLQNRAAKADKKKEATAEPLFLGITKISLSTESWLSAASFQETSRVLINAAVTGKVDGLDGLKENVIIGRLIPAGTGFEGAPLHEQITQTVRKEKEEAAAEVEALAAAAAAEAEEEGEE